MQRTNVVSAVFKDRLTIGGADDLADADDTAFGPGDDGCVVDAADTAVDAAVVEFLDPPPGVEAAIDAVADLFTLAQVHRARPGRLGGRILLVDVDGEGARFTAGRVDGDANLLRAALAEVDSDSVADVLGDRVAAFLDRGSVVVVLEDVFGDDARLGPAEGAVLAHADAVTPAASFEQDRVRRPVPPPEQGGHGDARKKAQNQKSMSRFRNISAFPPVVRTALRNLVDTFVDTVAPGCPARVQRWRR